MTPMNAAEQNQWLTDKSYEMQRYIRDRGAVKRAINERPRHDFETVILADMLDDLDIHPHMILPIKCRAIELGIFVSISGAGHYLSEIPGETATNITRRSKYMISLAESINLLLIAHAQGGTLEDAKQFSRLYLDCDLRALPDRLRTLGAALPAPLERAVLALAAETGEAE